MSISRDSSPPHAGILPLNVVFAKYYLRKWLNGEVEIEPHDLAKFIRSAIYDPEQDAHLKEDNT